MFYKVYRKEKMTIGDDTDVEEKTILKHSKSTLAA